MSSPNGASHFDRASGILLHPTSLPGRHGIGDLGAAAYRFVDFLADARQSWWQVLPLNPVGYGDSPYASPSAFAGNPLLISLDKLADQGLLERRQLEPGAKLPSGRVDYGATRRFKEPQLAAAFERFCSRRASGADAYHDFCARNAHWLDDHALFMALKRARDGRAWTDWEPELARHEPDALRRHRKSLRKAVETENFLQFAFFAQWADLKSYANEKGVRIIGDVPIFVAHDSVDVWANRDLFILDELGQPTVVAGVPPDFFSPTGQRWGNPLYNWERMAADGFAWWIDRLRATMELVDAARIDHFRGFQAYWEVPAAHETAEHGRWVEGPGETLFRRIEETLGHLPIIVEDLGLITPDVEELRRRVGYPGMKVLQFAFGGGSSNPYLPHNFERHCVVYTATHDNDTTLGWFQKAGAEERAAALTYLGTDGSAIADDFIRLALTSVADTAVVPLQDVLRLGGEARMNYPGRSEGNWAWRYRADQLGPAEADRLSALAEISARAAL